MNALNSLFTYGLMGSASVAVLALVVVGPNLTDLLNDGVAIEAEQQIDKMRGSLKGLMDSVRSGLLDPQGGLFGLSS